MFLTGGCKGPYENQYQDCSSCDTDLCSPDTTTSSTTSYSTRSPPGLFDDDDFFDIVSDTDNDNDYYRPYSYSSAAPGLITFHASILMITVAAAGTLFLY